MGTTVFMDNAYTGCDTDLVCATNIYKLAEKTKKARMITLQELVKVGCGTSGTCPKWMYGYLGNDTSGYGYWTMSANSSDNYYAWVLYSNGNLIEDDGVNGEETSNGARAVVVINK